MIGGLLFFSCMEGWTYRILETRVWLDIYVKMSVEKTARSLHFRSGKSRRDGGI